MKTLPAGLATWLAANNVAHRADTYKLTIADGTIYRWTSWASDIVSGGSTYLAAGAGTAPMVKRGPFSQNGRLVIDTLDLEINGKGFTIGGKSLPLLAAQGFFDYARVQVDHFIMPTPGDVTTFGPIASFFEGRVAGVEPVGPRVRLRLKSELIALNTMLPKFLLQPACGNAVYDTNCALVKATYTDAATANGGTTTTVTTVTAAVTGKAANYYVLGVVKFTSGSTLNGLRRSVTVSNAGTITLALPLPIAPTTETFSIYPGCDHKKATCGAFPAGTGATNNLVHFRGYPHIPTTEGGA